ncbi:cation:proton antiporter [Microcoleus sp. FACHB-831]|uniref:cation:proton antiporter domain-containing protein n=1 Tax=Microcoleus sp. FACHB-831 TaxID=2692827 RepID=UPI001685A932|nr:cation:proton antiporter [Microcoleus sp. FACHB-831]MBD1924052.1 cation:proton antiporter [Microcoleus sp. FACHB-831]
MQEDFRLIVDLVTVLAAAATGGVLAALCRQPALLGYIVGGMIVGPAGLGLIKELVQIETLAQFGVAFLLFALGVEFSFTELKKVKAIALGGGALQITLTIAFTVFVCWATGAWATLPAKGIFLGAILSLSSTAVVLKCLMERNEMATPHGQVMLGILVVQDLALGLMLAVLPALDQPPEAIGQAVALAVLRIALFAGGAVAAGIWLIPPLLQLLAKTESKELFLLGVVTLCLGIALLTEQLGLSIEMGAFVAGLTISEVEYADQTLTYVEPLRDVFAALFFAAIGMLIDPVFLWNNLELILGLVLLVFVGKFLIVTPIVRAFRYPWKTALIAGLGLSQIGEFSFVLASSGQALGLVSRQIYLLILGTTAVTLVLTPFVLRLVSQLFEMPGIQQYFDPIDAPLEVSCDLPMQNHVVVCGYGGVGRNLVRLLQEHNCPVLAIDQSERTIQKLRDQGIPYVYGNAASLHVLEKAGVGKAQSMAIALPDSMSTRLAIKRALEIDPSLDIVVRANHDRDIELLYQLGAREVVQPEFEASLEITTHVLTRRGMPLWGVQREMQQIRNSHYLDLRPQTPAEISRDMQAALNGTGMNSKWYPLPDNSPLVGMTLEETNLRWLTGASVVAIRRASGGEIDYPSERTIMEVGDRLLLVGDREELAAFNELAKGELTIPGASTPCQWLVVSDDSPAIGKTLSELHFRRQYGIQVQSIRREGKFIRFPDGREHVRSGDRLLLCGGSYPLNQLRQWIAPSSATPSVSVPVIKAPVSEAMQEYLPLDTQREV